MPHLSRFRHNCSRDRLQTTKALSDLVICLEYFSFWYYLNAGDTELFSDDLSADHWISELALTKDPKLQNKRWVMLQYTMFRSISIIQGIYQKHLFSFLPACTSCTKSPFTNCSCQKSLINHFFIVRNIILPLRTVPPFVTAHSFCASRDIRVGICPLVQKKKYVEKADLSKG